MNFIDRLQQYYSQVASVLRGEASMASVFPNTSDKGLEREKIYADFLKQHAPSKCQVFLGGFLFDEFGNESNQIDIIVTSDTAPRFRLGTSQGDQKEFAPVEGCLAVAAIKSKLDKKELVETLASIARLPDTQPLQGRTVGLYKINNYRDWPYKIIYAHDGISAESLVEHILCFYEENPAIPLYKRPNIIHVAGKYAVIRAEEGQYVVDKTTGQRLETLEPGTYRRIEQECDVAAISIVLDSLQKRAVAASFINFSYNEIFNAVRGASTQMRNQTIKGND